MQRSQRVIAVHEEDRGLVKENLCTMQDQEPPICGGFNNFSPLITDCKYFVASEDAYCSNHRCAMATISPVCYLNHYCGCKEAVEEMMVMYRLENI